MAYVMDEEEQQAGQQGSAPGATPATAAPSSNLGSAGGAPGTGFQNLSAYFGANQDAAKGQADSVVNALDAQAKDAYQDNDIDAAETARQDIATAQTQPGLASLYRENAPPTYTAGQAGLDAYLSGQARGDAFAGLTKHFGPLDTVGLSRDLPLSKPKTPEVAPEPQKSPAGPPVQEENSAPPPASTYGESPGYETGPDGRVYPTGTPSEGYAESPAFYIDEDGNVREGSRPEGY